MSYAAGAPMFPSIRKVRMVQRLYNRAKKEREIQSLLASVTGRSVTIDRTSPAISGNATMGDTIRIAHSGAIGTVSVIGDNFVGADFGICYSENRHGDYELIRRASA